MKIKIYLLFVLSVVVTNFTVQAQKNIDYENIFSLKHNQVAVPKGNILHIYSLKQDNWILADSLVLPSNYRALDGNIRKIYMLMEDKMIFHGFYGERNDTLYFDDVVKKTEPSHWIRTPYTTEKDYYVYENGREVAYFADGGEWFKINMARHVATLEDIREGTINKLYSFNDKSVQYLCAISDEQITFHRHDLIDEYPEAIKEMMFPLKDEHLTAFIYDQHIIAVISINLIRFYHYDISKKQWLQNSDIPDLKL